MKVQSNDEERKLWKERAERAADEVLDLAEQIECLKAYIQLCLEMATRGD